MSRKLTYILRHRGLKSFPCPVSHALRHTLITFKAPVGCCEAFLMGSVAIWETSKPMMRCKFKGPLISKQLACRPSWIFFLNWRLLYQLPALSLPFYIFGRCCCSTEQPGSSRITCSPAIMMQQWGLMGLKTQAGRQTTLSGRGTVGVKLFPAHDRC